jgi:KDO2-lipid IV(A) lauroyltransferase
LRYVIGVRQEAGRAFRHRFEGPLFRRMFLWGVRTMSPSVQRATMPMWAGIFYALVPRARRMAEQNLAHVAGALPSLEAHARSFRLFVNYAQTLADMYSFHVGNEPPMEVAYSGRKNVTDLLDARRGVILATGHMGAWQLAPFFMQRNGLPPPVIAMAEEPNAELAEFERRFRDKFKIVYVTSSPFATLELAKTLREAGIVAMQMDRAAGGPTVEVEFCGTAAKFPVGPATLARATRCPLVPAFSIAENHRRHCRFYLEEPIEVAHTRDRDRDLREATARLVQVYERFVKKYPEQWFNFYDFWNPQ